MARHRLYNMIEYILEQKIGTSFGVVERSHTIKVAPVPDSPNGLPAGRVSSFHFQGKQGHFTARQERKQRGETYWYAYRKAHQLRFSAIWARQRN